jgi:hypothetical protein
MANVLIEHDGNGNKRVKWEMIVFVITIAYFVGGSANDIKALKLESAKKVVVQSHYQEWEKAEAREGKEHEQMQKGITDIHKLLWMMKGTLERMERNGD